MIKQVLSVVEIVLGILLVVLILLQSKGTGIGSTFGGDMGFYATKRGAEKLIFMVTIVLATIFLLIPVIGLVI